MLQTPNSDSGFWYDTLQEPDRRRIVAVLQAMRRYRESELAMRRRTREAMSMGENDMVMLRHLLQAHNTSRFTSPSALARQLGVSTASMTAMIDRLERSGHVRRERHATDRRSIYVVPTERAEHDMRHLLGDMHERMLDAISDMTPAETEVVLRMLARLQAVVDDTEPQPVGASDGSSDPGGHPVVQAPEVVGNRDGGPHRVPEHRQHGGHQ